MLRKIAQIVKNNWVFIAVALVVLVVLAMMMRKERYIEGCSLCSLGDAGVLPQSVFTMKQVMDLDKEVAGCSTCEPGDAGVLADTETEMYQMPDEYYGSDDKVADTIAEVADNPSVIAAVVEDREEDDNPLDMTPLEYQNTDEQELDYLSPMQYQDDMAQAVHNMAQDLSAFTNDGEDSDLMSIDPIDYALQSDDQLVNDFYGDQEVDYKERKEIMDIKAMPIDFMEDDSAFTLL